MQQRPKFSKKDLGREIKAEQDLKVKEENKTIIESDYI